MVDLYLPSAWKQSTIIPILNPENQLTHPTPIAAPLSLLAPPNSLKEWFLDDSPIFLNTTASFQPYNLVLDLVDRLWIRFSSHSRSQILFTSLNQAHMLSLPLWILRKLLTQSGILPSTVNSSVCVFCSTLSNGCDLISHIAVRNYAPVIPIVVFSVFEKVFPKVQFLDHSFSLYLLMVSLPFFLHLLRSHCTQMTLHLGLFPKCGLCNFHTPSCPQQTSKMVLQTASNLTAPSTTFATPPRLSTYPLYPTAASLSELMARFLAGWGRVVQESTLSVRSVSLLPPSFSRLDSGPPATVPRPMPFHMLLRGASLTPKTCAFESVTLFSDSLSVLLTLFAPLPYLTPESLFNTQSLLIILSDSKVVHFQ